MTMKPTTIPEAWDACDGVDTVFILICTVICWSIIPAVSPNTPQDVCVIDGDKTRWASPTQDTAGNEML